MKRSGVWLILFLLPLGAGAFFPTAEKSTPGEVLKYRSRKKEEYRRARQEHEQEIAASRVRVTKTMERVPWPPLETRETPLAVSEEAVRALHTHRSRQKNVLLLTGLAGVALFIVVMSRIISRMSDA